MSIINQKKQKKSKAKPVDRATPVIRKPKVKDADKIGVTRGITSAMKATPQWNANPQLQAAATAWNAAADAIESNAKVIFDLRTKLVAADALQRANRQDWRSATDSITGLVRVVSQGSPDTVHALGFDVVTHGTPAAVPAPSGLVLMPGTVSGQAVITWQRGGVKRGFFVQHATDVANQATYVAPVVCGKVKYTLENAPSGSVVHFRVAAIDLRSPTGMSPWSDWVACTVG
jgi:hypothetical protein